AEGGRWLVGRVGLTGAGAGTRAVTNAPPLVADLAAVSRT
ncbi:MAG: hypothetical protein QOE42_1432, partial [Chloroflexota bacterium]|nr:hypothetical protein [Chloroflexota bacterium]